MGLISNLEMPQSGIQNYRGIGGVDLGANGPFPPCLISLVKRDFLKIYFASAYSFCGNEPILLLSREAH